MLLDLHHSYPSTYVLVNKEKKIGRSFSSKIKILHGMKIMYDTHLTVRNMKILD